MSRPLTEGSAEEPVASIVLPTYNERDNVGPLIRRLDAAIDLPFEILVVDDASPDGTAGEVQRLSAELPHVRAIVRRERGLTGAIQRGIDESRGEVVMWMDCDLSMPPETVPQLIAEVRDGQDAAIGSRYASGGSVAGGGSEGSWVGLQRALTRRLNRLLTGLMGADFHDWTGGFIAIRASWIKSVRSTRRLRRVLHRSHGPVGRRWGSLQRGALPDGAPATREVQDRSEPADLRTAGLQVPASPGRGPPDDSRLAGGVSRTSFCSSSWTPLPNSHWATGRPSSFRSHTPV